MRPVSAPVIGSMLTSVPPDDSADQLVTDDGEREQLPVEPGIEPNGAAQGAVAGLARRCAAIVEAGGR